MGHFHRYYIASLPRAPFPPLPLSPFVSSLELARLRPSPTSVSSGFLFDLRGQFAFFFDRPLSSSLFFAPPLFGLPHVFFQNCAPGVPYNATGVSPFVGVVLAHKPAPTPCADTSPPFLSLFLLFPLPVSTAYTGLTHFSKTLPGGFHFFHCPALTSLTDYLLRP